jgi:phosphoglycerate dehydrogenase-like enzyme
MTEPRCSVLPADRAAFLHDAVVDGGGRVVDVDDAEALIWVDPGDADGLRDTLRDRPDLRWVQLPWAGIEPFVDVLDHDRLWTCGKGVYAEPVAEHALALGLAGLRAVGHYARQHTWSGPHGRNLLGGRVTILGGGEITRSLTRLLQPFGASITVVRRHAEPLDGVDEVVETAALHRALREADLVVLALALTPETDRIIDAAALRAMSDHAWLVNVARGRHVDTDALVAALEAGDIGGAALDVTDPEPLPDGHPLWHLDNCLLTPHVGNTPEMGRALLAERVRDNVHRYATGERLLGPVHVELGY